MSIRLKTTIIVYFRSLKNKIAMQKEISILWVDDEIDLLKPQIIFLESKGYKISSINNGSDAIDMVANNNYDLVFLDENMPGLSGLETLSQIKKIRNSLPVVMITKSEEEFIMDEAIGSQIADYLIKPVNPKQILMAIKKITEQKRLISEKTTMSYQAEFNTLGIEINNARSAEDWKNVLKKLSYWELELQKNSTSGMEQILQMQKTEANRRFCSYVVTNYESWFSNPNEDTPVLSPNIFKNSIFPLLKNGEQVLVLVIDCLRFDQWKAIEPLISLFYNIEKEDIAFSILPTSTQFARNAMFAGLMPSEIEKLHSDLWVNEDEDEAKNNFEPDLLQKQLDRMGVKTSLFYDKIHTIEKSQKLLKDANMIMQNQLSVLIINFVDMMSHARTDLQMIRELAADEKSYRSITKSWFEHSTLFELMKNLANKNIKVIITADHGSIRVTNPIKVIGDKTVSSNLRYKQGKNLNYNPREVFEIKKPQTAHLPLINVSTTYIFATNYDFFAYPNNYNYYVQYFRNTFQHGGISMEEMMIPLITLTPRI